MGWRNWSYKLKGSIVITVIFLLLFIILIYSDACMAHPSVLRVILLPAYPILIVFRNFLPNPYTQCPSFLFIGGVISLIIYAILGFLVGLVIEKIKSKK